MFPLVTPEQIIEIDTYFNSIRPWFRMPAEDFQKWKLIKKFMPIVYKSNEHGGRVTKEAIEASIALSVVEQSGVPIDILGELILCSSGTKDS